ncbi:unnamed protein product, partial [Cylicostephanus goldi]
MQLLLFLLSIGGVFCATAYDPYYPYGSNNQNVNNQITTLDGILARASPQAIRAYTQIVQNFSQSLNDVKIALESWSRTYGLEKQSIMNAFNKTAALTSTFDEKQKAIIELILKTYLPSLNSGSNNQGIPVNNGGYPGSNSGSPINGGGIPNNNGGYPGSNTGYPTYGGVANPGYPGYPTNYGGYPVNNGAIQGGNGGYPSNNG